MVTMSVSGLDFLRSATSAPGDVVLASSPHVELALGHRVIDHELERATRDHVFRAGDAVFAWSALVGVPAGFVEHVWSQDGVEVSRHCLPVGSHRRWLTWSRVVVRAGLYQVRVIGPDGTALAKTSFRVVPALPITPSPEGASS